MPVNTSSLVMPPLESHIDNAYLRGLRPEVLASFERVRDVARLLFEAATEAIARPTERVTDAPDEKRTRAIRLATQCDHVIAAANLADLDTLVHISTFYYRHKLREEISKLLGELIISSPTKVSLTMCD
jgi:hypothetical protein